jgi:hypothetical protein
LTLSLHIITSSHHQSEKDMGPRERRLVRRTMMVATVLVALMVAAMVWAVLRNGSRGLAPRPEDAGTSSGSATQ